MRKDMLRGDSLFAVTIFTVVALFLFNLVASLWNNVVFQKDVKEKASVQRVKAVGGVLAKAAETLIAADELSMLRRTVAETGMEHNLRSCRIVLPDGEVLADADPGGITLIELPPSWEGHPGTYVEAFSRTGAQFAFPLSVPGRGTATLEVAARIDDHTEALAPQTAQMAIACLALASMLLVHRHARFRLKAIGAIHEILLAVKDGGTDFATLELDPTLGSEAVAWNRLLGERQNMQIRTAIEQVREAVHDRLETTTTLGAVFDTAPYGLVLVNGNMTIEHANGAAAVFLQAERDQLIHTDLAKAIKDPRVIAAVREATRNHAAKRVSFEVDQGGAEAAGVLRFAISSIRHEDSQVALITMEDITQQRVAAAAMSSFLAKAAHELRTPLTNIRLFVEDALERCDHDPAGTGKALSIINNETQRLDRTVAEVLSVSQIEAGSFEAKRDDVHVDTLLEQIKADHEAQAREKQIALEFNLSPKLPILQADRDKIALALHNLVGNALKYTPDGGRILVTAAVEKGQLSIAVSDTGLGIASDEIEKVFEKFYRSTNPLAAKATGSGLGLPIAREVARLHGGDVALESELGKGSTFTLTLPVAMEAA
jgi:two-component system phosphate regulon sensor histidine kinase PhoR